MLFCVKKIRLNIYLIQLCRNFLYEKVQKNTPKPYLKDIVHLNFRRGKNVVYYKTGFSEEFKQLNFLSAKEQKKGIKKTYFYD